MLYRVRWWPGVDAMSRKRNASRSPAEVQANIERAPPEEMGGQADVVRAKIETARAASAVRMNTLDEALALVQHARELEARRGRSNALPEGAFALQRLLIALLETLTPEQRAEVRRRLGE